MYKVLLVDDEELERTYLKTFIEKRCVGYNVVGEACNGREAIEFFQQNNTDIIFMDVKMPGINGLKATQKIKEINRRVKIIILSAYEEFEFAQQALRVGADEYLVKPAQPDDIITVLNQVLQKKHYDYCDIFENLSDAKEDLASCYTIDKEKTIIMAIKQNDLKLLTATFNELSHQLHKSSNKNSNYKLRFFELIIVLSRTLVDFGLNEVEVQQFIVKNFQAVYGINDYSEVQLFLESLQISLIDTVNINNQSGKELIQKVLNYINTHIKNDLSLECLSQKFHFSTCHISRLVKKETGLTYCEYLNQIRLTEAKKLLKNSGLNINKIAREVGYQEVSHFNRIFKKSVGLSPSKYRALKNSDDNTNQNI